MGFNKTFFGISGENPPLPDTLDYIIVAGGGQGSTGNHSTNLALGSGGGAGGVVTGSYVLQIPSSPSTFTITIGAGGYDTLVTTQGANGANSSISQSGYTHITASGGGGGGGTSLRNGSNGGSGGGAQGSTGIAGTGIAGQGFGGSVAVQWATAANQYAGGAGGGATSAATVYGSSSGQRPLVGQGISWNILSSIAFGGEGEGCTGGNLNSGSGGTGTYNEDQYPGSAGRPGIVSIRYISGSLQATGGQLTISGGYAYHTFPSSSTFTFNK